MGKTSAFRILSFVPRVINLFFQMLVRLVTAFLAMAILFLMSLLSLQSSEIVTPRYLNSLTVPMVSPFTTRFQSSMFVELPIIFITLIFCVFRSKPDCSLAFLTLVTRISNSYIELARRTTSSAQRRLVTYKYSPKN